MQSLNKLHLEWSAFLTPSLDPVVNSPVHSGSKALYTVLLMCKFTNSREGLIGDMQAFRMCLRAVLELHAHICAPNILMIVPSTRLVEPSPSLQKGAHYKVKWLSRENVCCKSFCGRFTILRDTFMSGQRSSSISCSCLDVSSTFETIKSSMKRSCSLFSFGVGLTSWDWVNSAVMCEFNVATVCRRNRTASHSHATCACVCLWTACRRL